MTEYGEAAERLMEKALITGDGQMLKDIKMLMDTRDAAWEEGIDEMRDAFFEKEEPQSGHQADRIRRIAEWVKKRRRGNESIPAER